MWPVSCTATVRAIPGTSTASVHAVSSNVSSTIACTIASTVSVTLAMPSTARTQVTRLLWGKNSLEK